MTAASQMQELEAALARAVASHRAGRLEEAAAGYQLILDAVPGHARTLHLLGRIRLSQRRIDDAIDEHRAFVELIQRTGLRFDYVGYFAGGMQVAVRITGP